MESENETQVLSPLAAEIIDAHDLSQSLVQDAREHIDKAVDESLRCAALVDAAKGQWGSAFKHRWREEVRLDPDQARRYLTLHKAKGRRIDKAQLLLLGIVEKPEDEQQHERRTPDPFAWAKHVAKARQTLTPDQIGRMNSDQREVARNTLKPIVELYNSLA